MVKISHGCVRWTNLHVLFVNIHFNVLQYNVAFTGNKGNRQHAENHVIIVTDQPPTADKGFTVPFAKRLREGKDAHISVLAIGDRADNLELRCKYQAISK